MVLNTKKWNGLSLLKLPTTLPTLVHSTRSKIVSLVCLILESMFSPAKTHHPMLITLSMNLKSFSFSQPPPNSKCHCMLNPYYAKTYNTFYVSVCVTQHSPDPTFLTLCSLQKLSWLSYFYFLLRFFKFKTTPGCYSPVSLFLNLFIWVVDTLVKMRSKKPNYYSPLSFQFF